jgi:hypothetical protein
MFDDHQPAETGAAGQSGLRHAQAALATAAAALRALSPGELADESLSGALCEWDGLLNQLDAARVSVLGAWDGRCVWASDGARSGAGWVASHTELSRPAAAALIHTARELRAMPATQTAFAAGQLGLAKVRLLAAAAGQAPELFASEEAFLVEQVVRLRVDEAAKVLAYWSALANPDGTADRHARQHEARRLHLSQTIDGMWRLDGDLTPEMGEVVRDAIDRITKRALAAEKALADATGDPISTSAAQRRADALVELARHATAAGEHGNGLNVAAITAVVNADTLADPSVGPAEPVGETANGEIVTKAMAERLSCDCSLSRVVMGPDSVPVDLGMTARLPSPAQRRALAARYRGCAFPGCDVAPGWTSAHHIIHWNRGGPTDLQNLVPLCPFHHHRVHEGGFGLERRAEGSLHFTRPDGTHLTVLKHRAPDPATHPPHRRAA